MADLNGAFSLGTFQSGERQFAALVIEDRAIALTVSFDGAISPGLDGGPLTTLDLFERWDSCWPALEAIARQAREGGLADGLPIESLRVLPPVSPRQIICSGANYRTHVIDIMVDHEAASDPTLSREERRRQAERIMDHRAAEGQPFAFVKPYSALLAPFDDLTVPADSTQLDWELELGVVIGKPARRVSRDEALSHVAGYVVTNDISARDHISRPDFPSLGLDWISGKGGPGFLPIGPYIVPARFIADPQNLMISLKLNGQVMQRESTANMIFPIARLIEFLSTHMQLLPGDVICTGSPQGNGTHYGRFLRPGDVLEGAIDGLGVQRNRCVAETLPPGAVRHRPFAPLAKA